MISYQAPDLTRHPPRSPRARLGGYAHLPRLLDKARAFAASRNGEYNYNCPLDQLFFGFTGLDADALLAEVKKGKTDGEILEWVNAGTKRHASEVEQWSAWISTRSPGGGAGHGWFHDSITRIAPQRDDIRTFFELLDLDDYVSFGGKA